MHTQVRFFEFILDTPGIPDKERIFKWLQNRRPQVLQLSSRLAQKVAKRFPDVKVLDTKLSVDDFKGKAFDAALLGLSTFTVYYTQKPLPGEDLSTFTTRRKFNTLANVDNWLVSELTELGATAVCLFATKGAGSLGACDAVAEGAAMVVASVYSGSSLDKRITNLMMKYSNKVPYFSNFLREKE